MSVRLIAGFASMIGFSRTIVALAVAVLTALLLLTGCDFAIPSTKEDPVFNQTRILRVEVEPNPVAVGDTAVFTCVIADSTDGRFTFTWTIEGEGQTVTEKNHLRWVAEAEPGTYSNGVRADNGSEDSASVSERFNVEVVE